VLKAALAAVAVLLPAAEAGATTAAAPDPCAVPVTFTGYDANFTQHLFYRAGCSSLAKPLDSVNFILSQPVLMPGGTSVIAIGNNGDPYATDLEITDIATGTSTSVAQAGPPATEDKKGLSVAPNGSAVAYIASGVWVQKLDGSPGVRGDRERRERLHRLVGRRAVHRLPVRARHRLYARRRLRAADHRPGRRGPRRGHEPGLDPRRQGEPRHKARGDTERIDPP
jgi:hypothetical protein